MSTVVTAPFPAYQNLPIEPQFYQPSRFVISAITLGQTTTVTTSVNHNYVVGQLCRLLIPNGYGATQLNEQTGYVASIPAPNQVILTLVSNNSNAFINAALLQQPQILAVGDVNTGVTNTIVTDQGTAVLGAFINISPN